VTRRFEVNNHEQLAEIDDVLLNHLDRSPWGDYFDLISGLVGWGADDWDAAHADNDRTHRDMARRGDKPIAALGSA